MNPAIYLAIGLLAGTVPALIAVWWLRGRLDVSRPLTETEQKLSAGFNRANADMAARVEQIKGDLRADLAEKLGQGLNEVRNAVEHQLSEGRKEQAETASGLERKFEALKAATETKLGSLTEKQTEALRESRQELSTTLHTLGNGLQEKFDKLKETQGALASEAREEQGKNLRTATDKLQKQFESLESKTEQKLEAIRARVDERLRDMTGQVQEKLEKNIKEGFAHFQKVQEHLKAAEEQLRNVGAVGQSLNELNSLLKLPHLRGKFGEAELGRLLSDFLPAGTYEEQVAIVPDSKEAVDAVVNFPTARLPIDSKFNREQILPLFESSDPLALKEARKQLAAVIKQQAQSVSEKYVRPEHGTTDLALMFLPSETIYFEVIRNVELCEALHKLKVFPVSPNTLAITLKSIAMSFGFYEFAKNVEKTLEQVKQAQKSFGLFQKKFEEVGKGLEKAQQAYGTAASHLSRYSNKVVKLTGEPVPEIEGTSEAATIRETQETALDSQSNGGAN